MLTINNMAVKNRYFRNIKRTTETKAEEQFITSNTA